MNLKPLFFSAGILALTCFFLQTANAQPPVKERQDKAGQAERGKREKGNRPNDGPRNRRPKPSPEMLIERFDKDGDGKLAKDEVSDRMQSRFTKFDTDQDGFVTVAELTAAMEKGSGRDGKGKGKKGDREGDGEKKKHGRRNIDPATMIQKMDKDGDQKISLAEAPARMQQNFAKIDANGDGFVEESELKVAMETMKKMRGGNREGKGGKKGKQKRQGNGDLKPVKPKAPPVDFPL